MKQEGYAVTLGKQREREKEKKKPYITRLKCCTKEERLLLVDQILGKEARKKASKRTNGKLSLKGSYQPLVLKIAGGREMGLEFTTAAAHLPAQATRKPLSFSCLPPAAVLTAVRRGGRQ